MSKSTSAGPAPAGGEWRIAETSKRCDGCGAPFLPEQSFFSYLAVDSSPELPTLVRKDYCVACWETRARSLDAPIFWKARRQGSAEDANVVDLNSLNQLFLQLLEDERPEVETLRYVVGLMLLRKKVLKVVRNAGGARGDLVFKDPRNPEQRMRMATPDLSEESLELLKEQLGTILG